jgi:hypothetical protein
MIGRLGVAILAVSITASAASAAVEFRGRATFSSISSDCDGLDANLTRTWTAQYRPANLGGNGKETSLSLFGPYYVTNFTLPRTELGGTFKNANATFISITPGAYVARINKTRQVPRRITPDGPIDIIEGEIKNFGGRNGCELTYQLRNLKRVR